MKAGWKYFFLIVFGYLILFFINKNKFLESLNFFLKILLQIIPIMIIIFILMFLINYFIHPKKIIKFLGKKSGIKGWIIAIISGILSHGPLYLWYPMLGDLRKKGMKKSLIATFLYNKSIKIPLIPFLIYYFSITYAIIFIIVTIIFSIISGLTTEYLIKEKD